MGDDSRRGRVGWLTFGLGIIDVLRWIPEMIALGPGLQADYYMLVLLDLLLSVLAISTGLGLVQGRVRAWDLSMWVWGALPASSGILLWKILPEVLGSIRRHEFGSEGVLPRLAFYGMSLASSPYAVWALFSVAGVGKPSRSVLAGWFAGGLVAGAAVAAPLLNP